MRFRATTTVSEITGHFQSHHGGNGEMPYTCQASQNDVSVFGNLLFMSSEATNSRVDCKFGGIPDPVSEDRVRGIRIFDISDIGHPKLVTSTSRPAAVRIRTPWSPNPAIRTTFTFMFREVPAYVRPMR